MVLALQKFGRLMRVMYMLEQQILVFELATTMIEMCRFPDHLL